MKIAQYPNRKCRGPVFSGLQDGSCDLKEWHAGPCADIGLKESREARDRWEEANPGWEKLSSSFEDPFGDVKP